MASRQQAEKDTDLVRRVVVPLLSGYAPNPAIRDAFERVCNAARRAEEAERRVLDYAADVAHEKALVNQDFRAVRQERDEAVSAQEALQERVTRLEGVLTRAARLSPTQELSDFYDAALRGGTSE